MSLGFGRRLFASSLVLVTLTNVGLGVYLESRLRGSLHEDYRQDLERHAMAMSEVLRDEHAGESKAMASMEVLDPLADRFGAAFESRVSVVGRDGSLLGDSEVDGEQLRAAENHNDRPEVIAARTGTVGVAERHSATIDTAMMYTAVRVDDDSGQVVRVSVPLSRIDEAIWQLRAMLLLAGIVSLLLTAGLAGLASRLLSSRLRWLIASTRDETGTHAAVPEAEDGPRSVASLADDLRRSVRQLGRERAQFEAVLETMAQAVLALDAKQEINTVNRAARVLLSLPEQVEGRPLLDFVRLPALQALLADAAASGSANAEFDYGTSPRRRLQAQATASAHGGGLVLVMHDVTELRRLETIRKDFVANVSHELRTPVAVIQANAETLLAGAIEEPERAGVFLDAMVRHADRLGRLVADLLDISRIEAGRYSLDIGPIDLSEMVERTFTGLMLSAQQRNTSLVSRLDGDWWVAGDDKALEQVLVNLISNAIKYTQEGGTVEVGGLVEPGRIRLEVRDDGPGIDPRHHERVFERFYRVDSGRARKMGGTGLGLAIVKHLVEAMGGQVGVEGRRPRGSIFWCSLPTAASVFEGDELGEEDGAFEEDELADEEDGAFEEDELEVAGGEPMDPSPSSV